MKKAEIIDELTRACDKYGIPKQAVLISYGAASVIMGTRRSVEEIDVFIPSIDYRILLARGCETKVADDYPDELVAAEVAYDGRVIFNRLPTEVIKDSNDCSGFRVVTPKQLILDRIELGRKKDMVDVAKMIYHPAIRRLLNNEEVERTKTLFYKHNM